MANRPTHFEIHAADPQRAMKFYTDLFGWKFDKWGEQDYWMITTGPDSERGINGGLMPRHGENPDPKEPTPVIAYVCTVSVEDLDAMITRAQELGGVEALAKMDMGPGSVAYYKDTESNLFGMFCENVQAEQA